MNKCKRIKELVAILNEARDTYYNKSDIIMSDFNYDKLYDELEALEKETGLIMSNSPTQTVGYEVKSELKTVTHSHGMLSLAKTKEISDLMNFKKKNDSILMLKLDGLTILLTYEDGKLVQAETRGNGEVGEIITHNALKFCNIPLTIDYKEHCEFEGEAIIIYAMFNKINESLPKDGKYKNPRSLASGSVRQLDSSIAASRNVHFVCWKVPTESFGETMQERLSYAENIGFDVTPYVVLDDTYKTENDIQNAVDLLKNKAIELDYPIDGLVISYDNIEYGLSLGVTSKRPRHSLAFKFYDEIFPTKLLDVDWTMGKTGVLTPTIITEPIEIDGTTVERASVHNVSIFKDLHLTKGCTCYLYKANMIIPQCDSADNDGTYEMEIPKICPVCGTKTIIEKDNETEVLLCPNDNCKGKLLGKLSHFVSREAIDIDGLSESKLERFIAFGWINSFEDIFGLKHYKNDMINLEGFGQKSVEKLLKAIENSKTITMDKFLNALSIPLIGESTSKDIAKYCNYDIDKFCDIISNNATECFLSIDKFGTTMLTSMNDWFDKHFIEFLSLKNKFSFTSKEMSSSNNADLSGKTFVITGSLEHFENRNQLKAKLEEMGAKVSGSVSSKTTALINNDLKSVSSKNKKAKELNVPIWSEEELLKNINLL